MKNFIILLTVAKRVSNTRYAKVTVDPPATPAFTDKPWRIKSIVTDPAIIDAAIISSLQHAERNREFIFGADGKVWERKIAEINQQEESARVQNGTWVYTEENLFSWRQEDHTLIDLKIVSLTEQELKLLYEADVMKVTFTMSSN